MGFAWHVVLRLGLVLVGLVEANRFVPASPASGSIPRFPPAPAVSVSALRQAGYDLASREAYDALAFAYHAAGLNPASGRLPQAVEKQLQDELTAFVSAVAAAVPHPETIDDAALAVHYEDVRYARAAYGPLAGAASQTLERAWAPIAAAAFKRRLVDQQGRLLRTAAALGGLAAPQADSVAGKAGAGRAVLAPYSGQAVRLSQFSSALRGVFQGQAPVLVCDMDGTLSRGQMTARMAQALVAYLRSGGRFAVVSGNSFSAVDDNVIKPLLAQMTSDDRRWLANVAISARSGAATYRWNPAEARFEATRRINLVGLLAARKVDRGVQAVRDVVAELDKKYGLSAHAKGPILVEDWASGVEGVLEQMVVVAPGKDSSGAAKAAYDPRRKRRKVFESFLNRRFAEKGIPFTAFVAGRSSIDIGPDKSVGLQASSEELGVDPSQTVYAGDTFDGQDAPAARRAGIGINVGPAVDWPNAPSLFTEAGQGPEGLLPYVIAATQYSLER